MAEDFYHGKTSSAYWNTSALTSVTGWSCTLNADTTDTTAMAASNHGKTKSIGFLGGTASVTCLATGNIAIAAGASAVLELLRDATNASKGYKGVATMLSYDYSTDKDNMATITYNFEWDGAVSNTVTEGS